MGTEYTSESENAELRRRAAWLLVMLVVVAALFVVVMVTFFNSSGGDGSNRIADVGPTSVAVAPSSTTPAHSPTREHPSPSVSTSVASSASTVGHPYRGSASCPSAQPCVLAGDVGDAVAAINAYRTAHGQSAVPGAVSKAAQQCALGNGDNCSGGWAETQVATADGKQAVDKILQFGKLLDPQLKSIEVGWAYDPQGKQFFFAIVRND